MATTTNRIIADLQARCGPSPNRDKVRALGNGVTPPVAEWICQRVIPLLGR